MRYQPVYKAGSCVVTLPCWQTKGEYVYSVTEGDSFVASGNRHMVRVKGVKCAVMLSKVVLM